VSGKKVLVYDDYALDIDADDDDDDNVYDR